jgi:tetratricopeptide (TPR) repeat protein
MVTIAQALEMAGRHHRSGELPQAEQICLQILHVDPRNVEAMHLLGVLAHQAGRSERAAEFLRQALSLDPDCAKAHASLGMVLARQGKLAEAVGCYQQALRKNPNDAQACNNLANAYRNQGRIEEAVASYCEAVRLQSDYAEAHSNLGVTLLQHGRLTEAVPSLREALRLKPDNAEAQSNLGVALLQQRELTEAVAHFQGAVRLRGDIAQFHSNLGMALSEQGKLVEAEACYRQALRLKPDFAGAFSDLGAVLVDQLKLTEAVACYQQALRLNPSYAEVHMNLAYALLLQGDFDRGWAEFEWRWKCRDSPPPSFREPLWNGSRRPGQRILLFAEQGLGDTLHFIRYAPLVQQVGAFLIVQSPRPLFRLLTTCAGIDQLVLEDTDPPPHDIQASLVSLPRIFQTRLATVPAQIPYLSADPELCLRWQERLSGVRGFRVGIAWQGNPNHIHDRHRSVSLLAFEPLAGVPGVRLVSLQKSPGREQLFGQAERLGVLDLADQLGDFADTAALMSNLDLVITVDSAVAHAAGALGIPVWVALSRVPDWRWLIDREDSPWYPSMRLFRQTTRGHWADVFERLTEALARHTARGRENS